VTSCKVESSKRKSVDGGLYEVKMHNVVIYPECGEPAQCTENWIVNGVNTGNFYTHWTSVDEHGIFRISKYCSGRLDHTKNPVDDLAKLPMSSER
jgi:hypothetical protein